MPLPDQTPLPWRAGYRALDIGCENVKLGGFAKLFDVRGWGYLTGTGHGGLGLSQDEAAKIQNDMTAFLIRAVNSHDTLVTALKEMTDHYCDTVNSGDCGFWDPETEYAVKRARAALALVEQHFQADARR